jgi:hypothetical protein
LRAPSFRRRCSWKIGQFLYFGYNRSQGHISKGILISTALALILLSSHIPFFFDHITIGCFPRLPGQSESMWKSTKPLASLLSSLEFIDAAVSLHDVQVLFFSTKSGFRWFPWKTCGPLMPVDKANWNYNRLDDISLAIRSSTKPDADYMLRLQEEVYQCKYMNRWSGWSSYFLPNTMPTSTATTAAQHNLKLFDIHLLDKTARVEYAGIIPDREGSLVHLCISTHCDYVKGRLYRWAVFKDVLLERTITNEKERDYLTWRCGF